MNKDSQTNTTAIDANTKLAEAVCKPILFSTPMVQAILRGEKSQTRRLCHFYKAYDIFHDGKHEVESEKTLENMKPAKFNVGDILWVRETFQKECEEIQIAGGDWSNAYLNATGNFVYRADGEGLPKDSVAFGKWKPSLFMPKDACRIFLEVTEVRVERLQQITDSDIVREGAASFGCCTKRLNWHTLWVSINGEESWNQNPFVWVYSFKQVARPHGFR